MTTASIHLLDPDKTSARHRLSSNKTAFIHLLSAAKSAVSAVAQHPRKGKTSSGEVADNGSVPLPEAVLPQTPYGFPNPQKTVLPQTPYGFPILQKAPA